MATKKPTPTPEPEEKVEKVRPDETTIPPQEEGGGLGSQSYAERLVHEGKRGR